MGFGDLMGDVLDDVNPLHWINKLNDAIGSSTADILQFLGITDPAVDPDGIRDIARTWKDLADALGDANFRAGQAVAGLALQGQAGSAFAERAEKVRGVANQVEDALYQGHDGLTKLADEAHGLISQVGVLAAQIAEFEVAGLGLSLLTGPLSDAAAALASGSRAQRIIEIFGEVEAMVVRAGKMIEDLCAEIGGLSRILKALETVAKLAFSGAKSAVAWDAMFTPGRLTDPAKLGADVALGAGGEIGLSALGKSLGGLRGALGRLGLDAGPGALAGFGPDALRAIDEALSESRAVAEGRAKPDPLDADQAAQVMREFEEIGGDPSMLRINRGGSTGYVDGLGIINVRGDVFPKPDGTSANATLDSRAALAHELGHAHFDLPEGADGWFPPGHVDDEARASAWAAINVKGLTLDERMSLIHDAQQRGGVIPSEYDQGINDIVSKYWNSAYGGESE